MKVVPQESREPRTPIDYVELAKAYNALEIGGAVVLPSVYNITNFRQRLIHRGLENQVDFTVFNKGGETLVKRGSLAVMTQE